MKKEIEKEKKDSVDVSEEPETKGRKYNETIIGVYAIVFALIITFSLLSEVVFGLIFKEGTGLEAYTSHILPFITCILLMVLIKRNKYMAKKLSFKGGQLLLGLAIGATLNIICAFAAMLDKDLVLKYGTGKVGFLVIAFILVFIQSMNEEIWVRLFMYQRLNETYKKPWIVILATSLFFGLIHLSNPGVTIVSFTTSVLYGVFMGMLIYYFDCIWLVSAIHASWNYMQNFVLGLPNSGIPAVGSIYVVSEQKNSFFYDTIFGIEGSIFAIIVLIIACVIVYLLSRNKKVDLGKKELSN